MSEGTRHRGTAGVAAVIEALDQRLENEAEILDAFLLALARNQLPKEAWSKLHEAAKRDDRITELAFAFEGLALDRKLRREAHDQGRVRQARRILLRSRAAPAARRAGADPSQGHRGIRARWG